MSYYQCRRCNFISKQKTGMIRHLCRKNKCVKNLTAYRYNDDELYNLSLNIVKENSNSLIFNNICQYCNKNFSTRGNLKKHLKKHEDGSIPIIDELNNDEDIKLEENNNNFQNENKETSLNQTINNITVNQQFNNYNIINVKYPNSFDKDWDLSQLSYEKKLFLISCCNTKYSELLKYILQNDDNLNVIIENETNTGIVYKNDIEKYIHLNKSDIIDQSLTKLNQQLNNLCKEISIKNDTESQERLEYESLSINKKFNDYKVNNNNIKNGVEDIISNIFNEKKDKAINMMNKIIEYETKDNLIENNGF